MTFLLQNKRILMLMSVRFKIGEFGKGYLCMYMVSDFLKLRKRHRINSANATLDVAKGETC